MATVTIKHASLTGAAANPNVLVDGPKWDADHTITGLEEAIVGSGVDDTAAIDTAIAAAVAAGGGIIRLSGHCVYLPALAPSFTGTSNPRQASIRFIGNTVDFSGYLTGLPTTGTILDLRYDGVDGLHPAKIDTRGAGVLEFSNMTIASGGTDDFLICQTTNTTLKFSDVHIRGNAANSGTACVQDAIQFGGITSASSTLDGVLATNGFQGYGTSLKNVYFSNIRHALNFGGSANGIHISNLVTDISCGSSEAHGAPISFYGAGLGASGNYFSGGIVELNHYAHGISVNGYNPYNTFLGIGLYDPSGTTLSAVYANGSGFGQNTFIPSIIPPGLVPITGAGSSLNTVILNNGNSLFPYNISGGADINALLSLSGSSSSSAVGDAVAINNDASRTATFQKAGIQLLRNLFVQNTVAATTLLSVNGVAANLTVDNAGGGQNYLDGVQTNFRSFAGVLQGLINATGFSSSQLTSTVTTGTPPLVVASTTQVPNLNAALAGNLTATAMAAYTPTVTSSGGALTSYSVTSAAFKTIGSLTYVRMRLALTNVTGASGVLRVDLPVAATVAAQQASGTNFTTKKQLTCVIANASFTTFDITLYDGTFPAVSGDSVTFNFWYE